MKRIQFSLTGGFNRQDLEHIHKEVLDVMSQVGVECLHDPTLDVMARQKGVTVQNGRVMFAPELVNEYI